MAGIIPANSVYAGSPTISFTSGGITYINQGEDEVSETFYADGAEYTTSIAVEIATNNANVSMIFASSSDFSATWTYYDRGRLVTRTIEASTYTKDGNTVYYVSLEAGSIPEWEWKPLYTYITGGDLTIQSYPDEIAWLMVYGGYNTVTVSIPVQWQTDYQTEPYEDTFDITVEF